MKKNIKKIFLLLFVLFVPIFCHFFCVYWTDILSQVFGPSKQSHGVIYLWDDKNDVWNSLVNESTSFSRWTWFYERAPLIVKIVRIILKLTVVLSVTMVIFYSVKFMLQIFKWNDYKSATAKKDLINVFVWLFVALFSITAVNLVISIPKSSLITWEDLGAFEAWCRINGNVYWWLEFKEYLCKNTSLWYFDDPSSRSWQYIRAWSNWPSHMDDRALWAYRCRVIVDVNDWDSWKWIRIRNDDLEIWCSLLWWIPL